VVEMNIGDNIKKARELKRISQVELSGISEIPRISLGRYERNERDINTETLSKIAKALKIDTSILLVWTNNIITNNDVFNFLNNFYPSKFYDSDKSIDLLQDLINTTYDNAFSIRYGNPPNIEVSIKFSKLFNLTNEQIHSWVLSSKISNYIFKNYSFDISRDPELYNILVNNIIELNTLNFQSIDDLFENNLSIENNIIIDDYITNQLVLVLNKTEVDTVNKNNILIGQNSLKAKITKVDNGIELAFKTDDTVNAVFEYLCKEINKDDLLDRVNPIDRESIGYFLSISLFDKVTSVNKISSLETLVDIKGLEKLPQKAIDEINEHMEFIQHKYCKEK